MRKRSLLSRCPTYIYIYIYIYCPVNSEKLKEKWGLKEQWNTGERANQAAIEKLITSLLTGYDVLETEMSRAEG